MTSVVDRTSKKFIGAVKDEWQLYSDCSTDYTRGAPIGYGASSTVYAAHYHPSNAAPIPCALKVMDLDSLPPRSLSLLQRETQLMSLSKHPNVLRVRGTWMDGHKLYIAMRLMNKGSAADVMRYGWSGGMEEEVVRCMLKQSLEGLNYLHTNGLIHRDIKAANLLIDDDGTVLLGDLGVAASLVDDTHDQHKTVIPNRRINFDEATTSHSSHPIVPIIRPNAGKRKSFVGTPCWMAPELIQGKQYDSSADIWSFGITALELTQGRPPGYHESPHVVLLRTVQGAPPTLDRQGGQYKYSRAFKEIVESCLVKDPSKRPTAAELLLSPFFKSAKKKSYLVGAILDGLPPLSQRQERRSRPSAISAQGTIDSWDFSLTASPTSSLPLRPGYLRKGSHGSVRKSTDSSAAGPESVFEFEEEVGARVRSPVNNVDVVNEDDEQQTEQSVSDPPSPPDDSPSPWSSTSSGNGTSVENVAPILIQGSGKSTVIGSTSLPVPVPSRSDSQPNIETYLLPSSIVGPLVSSSSSPIPISGLVASTSAPPNLSQALSSASIWRKLTGNVNVHPKNDEEVKVKKSIFSRKANDTLVGTKSKTTSFLQSNAGAARR